MILSGCIRETRPPMTFPKGTGEIEIEATGFRDKKGSLLLTLFASAEGFPDRTEGAFRNLSVPVENLKGPILLEGIPYGEYALSAMHDENDDGRMNTNLLGIPTEGYAISNNPETHFGAPSFDEAAFFLMKKRIALHLEMRYPGPKGPPF